MRKLFTLMAAMLFSITMFAQNAPTAEEQERENKAIEAFLPTLDARRSEFVGQPAKKLFDVIRGSAFKIRNIGTEETSPWAEYKGKMWVFGLSLFSPPL